MPVIFELSVVRTIRVGTPLSPRNDYRDFRRIVEKAGLRQVRLHDLRHTAATLMLAQGVPARVIMEVLGHSQIGVTLNTYSHVSIAIVAGGCHRHGRHVSDPVGCH